MVLICGIDPGKQGAIVILDDKTVVYKTVMPVIKSSKKKPEYDIQRIVDVFKEWRPELTLIEKALLHPRSGKSAYYGNGFCNGLFQGILAALKLPYDIVAPKIWQKHMFQGLNQKDTKQASIMSARRLAPEVDWRATDKSSNYHDGLTDAFNIATYAFRTR